MDIVKKSLPFISIRRLTIFISCLILVSRFSEVSAQGTWGGRINQNTDIFTVTDTYHKSASERKFHFTRMSFGVVYKSQRWRHEIEVFVPEIKASFSHVQFPWAYDVYFHEGTKERTNSYSVRYALVRNVYSFADRFHFALGLGLNPYYQKFESIPVQENIYYASTTTLGASINVLPAFNFDLLQNRLMITADCPLKLFDFFRSELYIRNPAIPIRQQKMPETTSKFFMNVYTVRIGVTYWFGREAIGQRKN
jgi:hypothetical protein